MGKTPYEAVDHDPIIGRAMALQDEATAILMNEKSGAEDFEKAERMIEQAESLVTQSKRLDEIKTRTAVTNVAPPAQNVPDEEMAFANMGEYLNAVSAAKRGNVDPRLVYQRGEKRIVAKDMSGNVGASGGFLAPKIFVPDVMALMPEASIVYPSATVLPMATREIEMPALEQGGTTAGETHYFGGVLTYYVGEWQQITASQPTFRMITLRAHDLAAVVHVPNSLLADSAISLDAWLRGPMGIAGALVHRSDYAFLRGSGAGQPLGILNAGCTVAATRATGSTIVYDDLIEIITQSMPTPGRRWVAHISTLPQLLAMAGPSGNASYLWGSARDGVPNTLMGMPITFTEKLPALGGAGDIGLFDFSYYLIGQRQDMLFDESDQQKWLENGTSYKAILRHDGQPWLELPFTTMDGGTTLSPFVILAA